jgi:hypothetical protein
MFEVGDRVKRTSGTACRGAAVTLLGPTDKGTWAVGRCTQREHCNQVYGGCHNQWWSPEFFRKLRPTPPQNPEVVESASFRAGDRVKHCGSLIKGVEECSECTAVLRKRHKGRWLLTVDFCPLPVSLRCRSWHDHTYKQIPPPESPVEIETGAMSPKEETMKRWIQYVIVTKEEFDADGGKVSEGKPVVPTEDAPRRPEMIFTDLSGRELDFRIRDLHHDDIMSAGGNHKVEVQYPPFRPAPQS